jgi:hypothetical protein
MQRNAPQTSADGLEPPLIERTPTEQVGGCINHEEAALEWLLKKIAIGFAKAVAGGEYERIKEENKRARDYGAFIHLMDEVSKQRLVACKPDELSEGCPMASVISHYHQEGNTSDGTAPLRMYTIIGSDGQIINVQGFDLKQTIKVTVRHTNGRMDLEQVDPTDAMKRIRREAGYLQ